MLILFSISFTGFTNAQEDNDTNVPDWVKQNFVWYGHGDIKWETLLNSIKFLIEKEMIIVPTSDSITCGDGTELSDGMCQITEAVCGEGTVLIDNKCETDKVNVFKISHPKMVQS